MFKNCAFMILVSLGLVFFRSSYTTFVFLIFKNTYVTFTWLFHNFITESSTVNKTTWDLWCLLMKSWTPFYKHCLINDKHNANLYNNCKSPWWSFLSPKVGFYLASLIVIYSIYQWLVNMLSYNVVVGLKDGGQACAFRLSV